MVRLVIILDERGHPLGANVTRDWDTDHERTTPLGVGPFDTPDEVLASLLTLVDFQMSLW